MPPGFSVLRNASHGRGVKATSGDLPSVRTDGRTHKDNYNFSIMIQTHWCLLNLGLDVAVQDMLSDVTV